MTQQPIKRRNPFERTVEEKPATKSATVVLETEDTVEDDAFVEEEPVIVKPVRQQPTPKQQRATPRQQYYIPEEVRREKYTSTMEVNLKRQIKIVCATRGIMFAKFVEDACKEKLAREGIK
ncbi:MAG: hypothetical protein NC090_06705 [Anaeroplasma bactoclasticum]|nr:hypothetical protein [Anaeroplasma bactoclasticum]